MPSAGTPSDLILSRTDVIASMLSFCASGAVRARDSAPIETHARSGARFTMPSPEVTITGGDCCANAGVEARTSARASVFMMYLARLQRAGDSEADRVRVCIRRD